MKKLVLICLSIAFTLPVLAAEKETHFRCDGQTGLSVQFDGPRYADSVFVPLEKNDVQQLILAGEVPSKGYLSVNANAGSCVRGDGNPVLVKCTTGANPWFMGDYSFSRVEVLAKDFVQSVVLERPLQDISKFELVVLNVNNKVQLNVEMTYQNSLQGLVHLKTSREVGTLGGYPNNCRYSTLKF